MAVVQISRIQIRRGKKNSDTSLPQLASGEMAWAIDTQELYIGNGSVAEGSPGVGNTKIITQKDLSSESNLFGLVQYVYKTSEELTVRNNTPVTRTLQERLDDEVTTTDFGTLGNYNIATNVGQDDSDTLQFAINQLYLNAANKASGTSPASVSSRVILSLPAGTFKITKPIYVPSYTTLIGAGIDKTIIYYKPEATTFTATTLNTELTVQSTAAAASMVGSYITGTGIPDGTTVISVIPGQSIRLSQAANANGTNVTLTTTLSGPAIQFVNTLSTATTISPLNATIEEALQPSYIQVSDMSIQTSSTRHTCLHLDAVRNSLFDNLKIKGVDLPPGGSYDVASKAIAMYNNGIVATENNIFRNIYISKFNFGVWTRQDVVNNIFENCLIEQVRQGFALAIGSDGSSSGETTGPTSTQIVNCKFQDIIAHAVYLRRGTGNSVSNVTLINVGVDVAGNLDPGTGVSHYPQIYFGTHGNFLNNIYSDRPTDLELDNFDIVYAPQFGGNGVFKTQTTKTVFISGNTGNVIRLPVCTNSSGTPVGSMSYSIDYTFTNTVNNVYHRVGTIIVSADIAAGRLQLSDEFNYAGTDVNIGDYATGLDFSAVFLDKVGDPYISTPQVPYSMLISFFVDGLAIGGQFTYSYTTITQLPS